MREPGYHEFRIRQGRTFDPVLTWKDDAGAVIDLTGWNAQMQVRPAPDDDTILQDLTVGAGVTLGGIAGTIVLLIDAAATASMDVGRYAYSLRVVAPGGAEDDLIYGPFVVEEEVTR